MHTVKLTYFKKSTGKYYSEGEYQTKLEFLYDIINEIKQMKINDTLPGIIASSSEFIICINNSTLTLPHIIF